MEMEIQHLHEHPLKLIDNGEKDGIVICNVCGEKLSGQIYGCEPCLFFLHESCLMLPQQIQHFFHPCPLSLKVSSTFLCNACYGHVTDFKYRCNQCDFDLDVGCAQLPSINSNGEKEPILHFCHRHPLQLSVEIIESKSFCRICEMLCSGPTWGCQQCLFHVHKSCLEILPQRIKSKLDPFPFILLTTPSYHCIGCRKEFSDLSFRSKNYNHLCVSCALVCANLPDSTNHIKHFFHPCLLSLKFSPFSTCNACFKNHSNFSYHCHKCDFFLDLECAQLTYQHQLLDYRRHFCHRHPLQLLRRTKDEIQCNLCEKFDSKFLFGCSQCNFNIHSSCIKILPQTTTHPTLNQTLVLLTIPSFTCTTCERACSGLTFYCGEGKLKFCVKCILWPENEFGDCGKFRSIHHWHQLTLRERDKIEDCCFLCGEYCSTSTYDCRECDACFHKLCAELPREIQQPIHLQHSLTLTSRSLLDPDGNICCKLCLKNLSQNSSYDGIYHCKECNMYLDTLCACCLPSIKYQGHRHLLSLVENMHGDANCQVCSKSCNGFTSFRCAECDFNIHLLCGPLPCTVKHMSHVHPLTLEDYYVEDNETDEFACHVCEQHRDPRLRVYRCAEGCLMICDVKCVISEVLKSLRGEHRVVELRTAYPQVACEVISEDLFFKKYKPLHINMGGTDENLETIYVFSLNELLDSVFDSFEEEETLGSLEIECKEIEDKDGLKIESSGALENENNLEECKEEDGASLEIESSSASENENNLEECKEEEEASLEIESSSASEYNSSVRVLLSDVNSENESMYAYSRKAFKHFTKVFYRQLEQNSPGDFYWMYRYKEGPFPDFLVQHDGSRMAGDYSLPETLNSIYEKIFEKNKIIGVNWKLSYPKKRFIIFLICSVFHDMHTTKVVDATAHRVGLWIGVLKFAEVEAGFKIGFMLEHIELIWKAHFLIKAKDIVDSKSSELHQQIEELSRILRETEVKLGKLEKEKEEHDAYRASGASSLKHVYKDALLIKWRSCYEPLAECQKWIAFGKLKKLCPAGKKRYYQD